MKSIRAVSPVETNVAAAQPPLYFDVIYFDTELKFSAERLSEIIRSRDVTVTRDQLNELLSRVCIKRILSLKELSEQIDNLQTEVILTRASLVKVIKISSCKLIY